MAALAELEGVDLDGLATRAILEQARSLQDWPPEALPKALIQRLNDAEARLVEDLGRQPQSPGDPAECAKALRRLRFDRERAAVQREIDRLQQEGAARHDEEILALWDRKKALLQQIESLMTG
jgi:hypothetical protein